MHKYAVTPSFGFTACAPRVYVVASNPTAAVEAAKFFTGTVGGYAPTHWPVALLTHFPQRARVLNAVS